MSSLSDYGGWRELLSALAAGRNISAGAARAMLQSILSAEATNAQVASFIMAMQIKGATADELGGMVTSMRAEAVPLDVPEEAIDIVGTGGTTQRRLHALNVSTMASFCAAAAGAVVCKHGSVKASSTSGSFDMLTSLGVNIVIAPEAVSRMVHSAGIGFAFAKTFHPAMRHVAAVRSEIGIPTVFNLLGPLAHPGHVKRQLLGVVEPRFALTMAEALRNLGSQRAMVVSGDGAFDELTTTGPNLVIELRNGELTTRTVYAADAGLPPAALGDLRGGGPEHNAELLRGIAQGEPGPVRDMVALNAGAALVVAEVVDDLASGVQAAQAAMDDGRLAAKIDQAVTASNTNQ